MTLFEDNCLIIDPTTDQKLAEHAMGNPDIFLTRHLDRLLVHGITDYYVGQVQDITTYIARFDSEENKTKFMLKFS